MFHCGSLCAINSQQAVKDPNVAKIDVILFPKREDGKIPSQIRGGGWQIHKTSKVPAIAYEFVKQPHQQGRCAWGSTCSAVTPRSSARTFCPCSGPGSALQEL